MSTQAVRRYTPEEYLAIERAAEARSEYYRGEMFAMVGAKREHNLISGNIHAQLHGVLKGSPCEVYISDMRVKASASGLYTYPDVAVACGDVRFEDQHVDTLLNPVVIFEVLSPSTEAYDRGRKFAHYQAIDTLREYVLVSQEEPRVEHFERHDDGSWRMTVMSSLDDSLELPAISCRLPLREIYARVEFPPPEPRGVP